MEKNGEIVLTAEDGSEDTFFVVEKAEIAGREYLLVTDQKMSGDEEEQDVTALILRANGEAEDGTVLYDVVEDEKEQVILSKFFEELVEDIQISMD